MYADFRSKPGMSTSLTFWVTTYITLLAVLYLLGYVPIWLKSREYSADLLQAERQLSLASMQNSLATAIIHAQSDDYESSKQATSGFFTSLRATTDIDDDLALSPAQREVLQPLLTKRDGIITLLARGDLASPEQLSDLYVEFREIIQR
jgi:hypothetical protein